MSLELPESAIVNASHNILTGDIDRIREYLQEEAIVLVRGISFDDEDQVLLEIGSALGVPSSHGNLEGKLIAEVKVRPSQQNLSSQSGDLALHTDSTVVANPQKIFLLQCVQQDQYGEGLTVLKRSREIYGRLQNQNSLYDVVCHSKFKFTSPQLPLSKTATIKTGEDQIRYRYDVMSSEIQEDMAALNAIDRLVNDSSDQIRFMLNRGELLVLDNTRVLHGRTAVTNSDSQRLLKRLRCD